MQFCGIFRPLLSGALRLVKDTVNELTRLVAEGRDLIVQFWPRSLLVLSAMLLPCALLAQVPKIADIPDSLPAHQRQKLAQTRDSLVAQKNELVKKAADHNGACSAVPKDTPEWNRCSDEQRKLEAERQRYIDAVNKFNEEVAKFISADGSPSGGDLAPKIGTAVECRGAVFIITPGGRQLPVQNGALPLPANAHVVTGPDGHFKMLLIDKTVFTLGANSDIVLDEFVYDPKTSVGKIFAALIKGTFRWVTGKISQHQFDSIPGRWAVSEFGVRTSKPS